MAKTNNNGIIDTLMDPRKIDTKDLELLHAEANKSAQIIDELNKQKEEILLEKENLLKKVSQLEEINERQSLSLITYQSLQKRGILEQSLQNDGNQGNREAPLEEQEIDIANLFGDKK